MTDALHGEFIMEAGGRSWFFEGLECLDSYEFNNRVTLARIAKLPADNQLIKLKSLYNGLMSCAETEIHDAFVDDQGTLLPRYDLPIGPFYKIQCKRTDLDFTLNLLAERAYALQPIVEEPVLSMGAIAASAALLVGLGTLLKSTTHKSVVKQHKEIR